jgi:hypothetical protein
MTGPSRVTAAGCGRTATARRALPLAAVLVLGAWGPSQCTRTVPAPASECAPDSGGVASMGAGAGTLAGTHQLTLVAAEGRATGGRTSGELVLQRYPGDGRAVTAPIADPTVRHVLHGAVSLSLDSIGAVAPGETARRDSLSPGVLVLVQRVEGQPDQVTLRLGHEANRVDRVAFDGSYLALTVGRITDSLATGRWRSGGGSPAERSGGWFCARRVAAAR